MPANFSDAEQRAHDPSAHEQRVDSEKTVGRNPHPDFGKVQASREDWREERSWNITKTRNPEWQLGDGANDGGESLKKDHVEIDPYAEGRPAVFNYKLLISGIVPRPIGFISTRSKDGLFRRDSLLWTAVMRDQEEVNEADTYQVRRRTSLRFRIPTSSITILRSSLSALQAASPTPKTPCAIFRRLVNVLSI